MRTFWYKFFRTPWSLTIWFEPSSELQSAPCVSILRTELRTRHPLLLVLDPTALVAQTHQLPHDGLHLVREPVPLRGRVRVPPLTPTARTVLVLAVIRKGRTVVERRARQHRCRLRVARRGRAFERVADRLAACLELRAFLPLLCRFSRLEGV